MKSVGDPLVQLDHSFFAEALVHAKCLDTIYRVAYTVQALARVTASL